ncbi:hypothetical protein Rxycam_01249 [Rubrobacter xylanophilus DSM 9941]|uniref:hypothetical protein n=1 Tax=Rubrobacter xylanophilus TaxID=49319 RepID=UPI001C64377B|nr:hypothetical protein [Rubrobacter xylanophilus]QYJ15427.1 hypothetical protein Rxycam_01249 [Rubrobacter xylanophilus DSM 9941]
MFVVLLVTLLVLAGGCGGLLQDPQEEANRAISQANEAIAEHNRHFERARSTYEQIKQRIEAGEDPSGEREEIRRARESMREARDSLREAREALAGVQELDVDPAVKRYARLLSGAMEAQLAAESRELNFYELLEEDPALEENRERALEILEEVSRGYERAERSYDEARELAESNPDVLSSGRQGG